MIHNRYEGQLNPAQMMQRLRQVARSLDVEVITAHVEQISDLGDRTVVLLGDMELMSRQLIVATNGLASELLNLEVKPARAQVLITEPIQELGWQGTFHYDEGFYYFRNVGNRVLLGGGRNLDLENEYTDSLQTTTIIQERLEEFLADNILRGRDYTIAHRWPGTMGLGDVKEPIVKYVSPRVIAAVRLGGMGVAIGSLVGHQAARLALG